MGNISTVELFTELLKIAQFYFSIIAHNANAKRIFFFDTATMAVVALRMEGGAWVGSSSWTI